MTLIEIFSILIIHWIADFIFQDEKWALGKSKNWKDLLFHTITYSSIWVCFGIVFILFNIDNASNIANCIFWFSILTFICHTITDYFTSRIVSKKFSEGKYGSPIPNFGAFSIIGIDQVLHYVQLFLTYYFLKSNHL